MVDPWVHSGPSHHGFSRAHTMPQHTNARETMERTWHNPMHVVAAVGLVAAALLVLDMMRKYILLRSQLIFITAPSPSSRAPRVPASTTSATTWWRSFGISHTPSCGPVSLVALYATNIVVVAVGVWAHVCVCVAREPQGAMRIVNTAHVERNKRAAALHTMACVVHFMCEPPNPPRRPAWPTHLRALVRARSDKLHPAGHCWHCGVPLVGRDWDVDHFPIPFRDIFDQLCCGVTDPRAPKNLVPSCRSCNRSHRAEAPNQWYFCGRTQPCCLRSACRRVMYLLMGCLVLGGVWAATTWP